MNKTIQGSNDPAGGPGIHIGFGLPPSVFPVFLATWHGRDGRTASVLLLGNLAGGYLLRTVVVEASGACSWDGATPFPPAMDPHVVWDQVEQQLDLIGATGEWEPDEPCVVDTTGFGTGTETARERQARGCRIRVLGGARSIWTLRTFGSQRIRHATATLLASNGMPFEEVSRYLGHSSTDVTRRYARQTPDALGRRAADALERSGLVAS